MLARVVQGAHRRQSVGRDAKVALREASPVAPRSPGEPSTPAAKQQNVASSPARLTPSVVAAGIAQGARSLAAGVAALGSRAFGGGASPMAAGASPARSRVLSPPRVLAPEEARPELAPPLSINLSYGCQAGDGAAAVPIQHLLYTKKYLKVVWNNWAAVF